MRTRIIVVVALLGYAALTTIPSSARAQPTISWSEKMVLPRVAEIGSGVVTLTCAASRSAVFSLSDGIGLGTASHLWSAGSSLVHVYPIHIAAAPDGVKSIGCDIVFQSGGSTGQSGVEFDGRGSGPFTSAKAHPVFTAHMVFAPKT